ncbi:MAG: hypothetical protein AAFY71_19965 [Bacteroidota bacterium]
MTEIKNYSVRINGGPEGEGSEIRAQIHLFSEDNVMVGAIDFYMEGYPLPGDQQGKITRFALPIAQLRDVVDLLRNEKPIYLGWQASLNNAYISTTQEPVGEGE